MQLVPQFLRAPVLAMALGFLLTQICGAQTHVVLKDRSGKPLKVGVQLYSVRSECAKDLPGVLTALSKMGYTGVEFAGYYGRTATELRGLLDQNHLECYGTHVDLNALQGPNLEKTAAFCKEMGCKFIVVPWLPETRRNSRAAVLETAKFFDDTAKQLAKEGLLLGWHNENYEFKPIEGETIWQTFWANSGKTVAMQFDIGNALDAGEQAAPYLLKYPKRVVSVHMKDHSTTNRTALLGEGDEHWNEVIPILKHKVAPRWFIVEQESYGEPPLVCVEKCLRNFEKLWTETPQK
ncbi:MAG: Sugar phosphate isomerase/epimerase [Chthonomonadaceae bacterium]|nr:Sugar phosphate isomerase/epimerase [Chthonomonadaceae bacterium]